MHDVVVEMSAKRLGVIGVTDEAGYLVGVITDGDWPNIERDRSRPRVHDARPKTIAPDALIDEALTLFEENGYGLVRGREQAGRSRSVCSIHDCPRLDEQRYPDPGALLRRDIRETVRAEGRRRCCEAAHRP